jgi:hypothetical protein
MLLRGEKERGVKFIFMPEIGGSVEGAERGEWIERLLALEAISEYNRRRLMEQI